MSHPEGNGDKTTGPRKRREERGCKDGWKQASRSLLLVIQLLVVDDIPETVIKTADWRMRIRPGSIVYVMDRLVFTQSFGYAAAQAS